MNYDTVHSQWFGNQFPQDAAPITAIVDLTMVRQLDVPFARHSLCLGAGGLLAPRAGRAARLGAGAAADLGNPRPCRADRAAFLSAAIEGVLGAGGFVFLPPHRPFERRSGLEEAEILRVLGRADFYL